MSYLLKLAKISVKVGKLALFKFLFGYWLALHVKKFPKRELLTKDIFSFQPFSLFGNLGNQSGWKWSAANHEFPRFSGYFALSACFSRRETARCLRGRNGCRPTRARNLRDQRGWFWIKRHYQFTGVGGVAGLVMGNTKEEALKNFEDAIKTYLETKEILKPADESFAQGWKEAMNNELLPIV